MCYPLVMAQPPQKQSSIKSFFTAQKRPRIATDHRDLNVGDLSDLEEGDAVSDPEQSYGG